MKLKYYISSLLLLSITSIEVMAKAKRIAVIGTHGVGKSTLAYRIATTFKKAGYNACVVQENSRECPFRINQEQPVEASLWMAHDQMVKELSAQANGYDFIICDRSVLDAYIYGKHNFEKLGHNQKWIRDWFANYDQIVFIQADCELDDNVKDAIRAKEKDFRWVINDRFNEALKSFKTKDLQVLAFSELKSNQVNPQLEGTRVTFSIDAVR